MPYDDYPYYFFALLLVSGVLILRFDVTLYQMAEMNKERKAARALGWLNVALACCIGVGYWIYKQWVW